MDWLEKLKVGDQVIIAFDHSGGGKLTRVERRTKTRIIVEGGQAFNSKYGRLVGSNGYRAPRLAEATSEALATRDRALLLDRARDTAYRVDRALRNGRISSGNDLLQAFISAALALIPTPGYAVEGGTDALR